MLRVLPPAFKPVNNLICCLFQDKFDARYKTRNADIHLLLQQCCKITDTLPVFPCLNVKLRESLLQDLLETLKKNMETNLIQILWVKYATRIFLILQVIVAVFGSQLALKG